MGDTVAVPGVGRAVERTNGEVQRNHDVAGEDESGVDRHVLCVGDHRPVGR